MTVVGEQTGASAAGPAWRRTYHTVLSGLRRRRWLTSLAPWLLIATVAAAAWLARAIGITRNYDVFIDELTYTRIADNLATGHGLVLYGGPFDLHPPAGFALYALVIKVLALHGGLANILFALRPFVALLGSITCALACCLVSGIAGWRAGAVVAVVAALDPFEIYFDSRVMLEAPGQLAAVLAILLLATSLRSRSERWSWALVVLSGIAAGIAICTKEDFGLVLALTLVFSLATAWVTERRKAAVALTVMCGCYILSESLVIASTGFQTWWNQNADGLRRLIGSEQISGFNSSTVHVSLVSRAAANATHFGITYLILGSGALAGVLQVVAVIRRRTEWLKSAQAADRGRILVALWAVAAAVYLCYATLFGTLEEQIYYMWYMPSLCTLTLLAWPSISRLTAHWRKIAIAVLAAIVLADSAVWVAVYQRPDDEYRQLLAWAPRHLPAGSTVAVTEYTAQFLLRRVILGKWATIPSLIEHHVDYVLLSTTLVRQGYGIGRPKFERYLQIHATVVFRATGASEGELIMYDVRAITGARI